MRKPMMIILILLLALNMTLPVLTAGVAYGAAGDKELTITAVEELPAMDIEDNAVPLAAGPGAGSKDGARHAVTAALLLAGVIAYIWYFSGWEKRLFALRKQAAEAEHRMMERRRAGHAAGTERAE